MRNTTKKISEETTDLDKNLTVDGSDIETSSKYNGNSLETPKVSGEPIEIYNNDAETDTLKAMFYTARECAANASADGHNFLVDYLATETENGVKYPFIGFFIADGEKDGVGYAVYKLGAEIYYRPLKELYQICQDVIDGVPGRSWDSLKYSYRKTSEPLDCYPVTDREDCLFIIDSIFSSMCGKSYTSDSIINGIINEKDIKDINESIKIRKHNKLGTDGLAKNSIKFKEAKYGTPEENSFKQEIEDKQKKDGTIGALDQQPQESVDNWKMKLPNVHNISEMNESVNVQNVQAILGAKPEDIEYEPFDRVVVKIDGHEFKGSVIDTYENSDRSQVVIVMVQGHTMEFSVNDVKPDTDYLLNTRWGNCGEQTDKFDLDKNTRLNNKVQNDKKDYSVEYKNLNDRTIECDIVVDGFKLNWGSQHASLQDIMESKKELRVMNESGEVQLWDSDNIVFNEWPWAVIVSDGDGNGDESDEPIRKIRINPTSYIEAGDEDMVECIINNEKTEMIKKNIKIIS